jgi:hypothetical protein
MNLNAPGHPGGHSALVRMRLQFAGQTFRISQMGPDFLFVESTIDHPPAVGRIELQVDASHRARDVFLQDGMKAGEHRVALALVPKCAALE